MNIVILIGTIVDEPSVKEFEGGAKGTFLTLRVAKPFKSMEGNYEADFIRCVLWEGIAKNTCEYCMKGDTIGIRGRISPRYEDIVFDCPTNEHKKKIVNNQIIVERVTFISTYKKNSQNILKEHTEEQTNDF